MLREHEELIKQFKGKKNTDDVLVKKAEAITPIIIGSSFALNASIFLQIEEWEKGKKETLNEKGLNFQTLIEIIIFQLHLLDRLAFSDLEIKQRDIFMDTLFAKTWEETFKAVEKFAIEKKEFKNTFSSIYNARMNEYGKWKKMFAEKDESIGGTLFWEFSKKLSEPLDSPGLMAYANIVFLSYFADSCYPILFGEK